MRVIQMSPFSSPSQSYTAPTSNVVLLPQTKEPGPIKNKGFKIDFKNFKQDDWILLGIIIILVLEGSDDYVLLCALGYLFVVGLL
ncbi:MAG: hypothetical protein ACI3XA_09665 [Clostridia bacterium]